MYDVASQYAKELRGSLGGAGDVDGNHGILDVVSLGAFK
jgi:hypothetical protein